MQRKISFSACALISSTAVPLHAAGTNDLTRKVNGSSVALH
jgi:hypothetical protein